MKLSILATVASVALAPTDARADKVSTNVFAISPGTLTVVSNGASYTALKEQSQVSFGIHFTYDTEFGGRIKSWKIWPRIKPANGHGWNDYGMSIWGVSESYPVGQRPKSVARNRFVSVPAQALKVPALALCNAEAQRLRNQGKSDAEIFSKDRKLAFDVVGMHATELTGNGWKQPESTYKFNTLHVVCAKWSGPQHSTPGGIAQQPKPTLGLQANSLEQLGR